MVFFRSLARKRVVSESRQISIGIGPANKLEEECWTGAGPVRIES
jgi:hypothetical protein